MGKARVTIYICDNPDCGARNLHTPEEPALGFHLTNVQVHAQDGGFKTGKVYACSTECIVPAILAKVPE